MCGSGGNELSVVRREGNRCGELESVVMYLADDDAFDQGIVGDGPYLRSGRNPMWQRQRDGPPTGRWYDLGNELGQDRGPSRNGSERSAGDRLAPLRQDPGGDITPFNGGFDAVTYSDGIGAEWVGDAGCGAGVQVNPAAQNKACGDPTEIWRLA